MSQVKSAQQKQGGGGKTFRSKDRRGNGKKANGNLCAADGLEQQCPEERDPGEDVDDGELARRFIHKNGW